MIPLSVNNDRLIEFVSALCFSSNLYVNTSFPQRSKMLRNFPSISILNNTCDLEDSELMYELPKILFLLASSKSLKSYSFVPTVSFLLPSKTSSPFELSRRLTYRPLKRSVTFYLYTCKNVHVTFDPFYWH